MDRWILPNKKFPSHRRDKKEKEKEKTTKILCGSLPGFAFSPFPNFLFSPLSKLDVSKGYQKSEMVMEVGDKNGRFCFSFFWDQNRLLELRNESRKPKAGRNSIVGCSLEPIISSEIARYLKLASSKTNKQKQYDPLLKKA